MAEVTESQFYERMQLLEDRMRTHTDEQSRMILHAFAVHELADRAVADRVLTLEVEKQTASKHGAIAGSLGAGLVVGLAEALKRLFGSHL